MTPLHPSSEDWIALSEGTLEAGEREALEGHARTCAPCAASRATLEEAMGFVTSRLRRLGKPPPLPALPKRFSLLSFILPVGGSRRRVAAKSPAAGPETSDRQRERGPALSSGSWGRRLAAVAAVLAVACGAWLLWPAGPVAEVSWLRGDALAFFPGRKIRAGEEIRTAAETRVGVRFQSGAEVVWNGGSIGRVESGRGVALSTGEVHVRAPAGARGFSVTTPHGRLVDLGTAFLVRADRDRTTALCLQGRIRAESRSDRRELEEGERAVLAADVRKERIDPPEADSSLRWVREAIFPGEFRDKPLSEVLDLLEAVTPYRFECDRARAAKVRIAASLEGASSEAIVNGLLRALGWPAEREGWTVRIRMPGEGPRREEGKP